MIGAIVGLANSRRPGQAPADYAGRWTDASIDGIVAVGRATVARVQHGSLPVYLVTMAAVATLAATPFLVDISLDHLVAWHTPLQGVLAATVVGAAAALCWVGTRLGAGLALGAAGITVAAVFVIHGAPDLALTQLLVEAPSSSASFSPSVTSPAASRRRACGGE